MLRKCDLVTKRHSCLLCDSRVSLVRLPHPPAPLFRPVRASRPSRDRFASGTSPIAPASIEDPPTPAVNPPPIQLPVVQAQVGHPAVAAAIPPAAVEDPLVGVENPPAPAVNPPQADVPDLPHVPGEFPQEIVAEDGPVIEVDEVMIVPAQGPAPLLRSLFGFPLGN
ncbi:hypothetical protein FRC11_012634 [Ceratobasidium sp. 423]|nr:hypothetical protein FRC11_012634 [Ceratobasidium sp. 423]